MRGLNRLGLNVSRFGTASIDLGGEPPLLVDGKEDEGPIRRGVHWRWLTGTVLTGFTATFLMGGALMVALNNPAGFDTLPAVADLPDPAAQNVEFGQKGDRLRPLDEEVASRQVVQVSTVTRQGERDYIKLKPFARITASLVSRKDLAANIPPYNAMQLFADTTPDGGPDDKQPPPPAGDAKTANDDQIYGANVDGEVSFKMTDFPVDDPSIDGGAGLDTPDIEQVVRAAAHLADGPEVASATASGGVVTPAPPDRTVSTSVRIVPENVSNIAKSGTDDGTAPDTSEKILTVAKGESFRGVLDEAQINSDDAAEIVAGLSGLIDLSGIHVGQKIRIGFARDTADPTAVRPVRVSVYNTGAHQATVARADNNTFVRADEPDFVEDDFGEQAPPDDDAVATNSGMPKVYDAIYETALEQQVPQPLIDQLIKIFAFDVDYQSRIAPGDQIQIFHSIADPHDPAAGPPEVLYASLTLGGVTRQFYRYRTGDDGIVDYYDEAGQSAKKFLVRKPITIGAITSGFGWRVHPILGYKRLHTGVDYAAPRGTPIFAAGNGVIEKAGPSSGYGNFILIKHTNGYETGYGHQQQFARGIVPGVRVHQGQLIGYVGSTGLSTGPHVHFEIRVNGTPVDPLRIRLPRGRVLDGDELIAFQKERARIDTLMGAPVAPPAKVAAATD